MIDAAEVFAANGVATKPRLLVESASPDVTLAAFRDVLVESVGLYDRGAVVRLHHSPLERGTKIQVLRPDDLVLFAHQVCRPYRIRTKDGVTEAVDARFPRDFADMYLGWQGEWRLPSLHGIACSPLLREDGSFHAVSGYDPTSGFWCERVPDLRPLVPDQPTESDARSALQQLRLAFRTFCFGDAEVVADAGLTVVDPERPPAADESAFLAALLTAVCRVSLPLAPGFVMRAASLSGAGAGKGLLARCIALIAFGQEPSAVSGGGTREEVEKRIASELMEAGPMLLLDNLNNRTFKSDLLASVMTERPVRVRILGRSQMIALNSSAFVVLTGNGLSLSEDLVRRFIVIELDPRTEDPEARSFPNDVKAQCRAARTELLAAAMTIWRWGRLAPDLKPGLPIGSFEQWARWVRDPLLALGCADPVARIGETKARDTDRMEIAELFAVWSACHGDQPVAAKDLADEVVQALNPLNRSRQWVASRLESLTATRMAGRMLVRQAPSGRHGVAVYALLATDKAEGHQGHRGHTTPASSLTDEQGPDDPDDPDAVRLCAEKGWRRRV